MMNEKVPTKKHIRDYCRNALTKGWLTEEEHDDINEWLPFHPDYQPHWNLCRHGAPNQQGGYGLCVFGDGKHWLTSYYNLGASAEAATRQRLNTACRQAVRSSRDQVLAGCPDGWEADHANPGGFKAIVAAFVSECGMPCVEYCEERGGWSLRPAQAALFREYHDARVKWQVLSPEEHRRITTERGRLPR